MPRLALMLSACAVALAALSLTACNQKDDIDTLDSLASDSMPLIATHAFETPAPVISIAFSPNDVASWLGIIATVDAQGQLVTSNIEGRDTHNHGKGPYVSVMGISRIKKPAAFLALTEDGKLRPFIETDADGNFKALPISSDAPPLSSICDSPSGVTDVFTAITKDSKFVRLTLSLDTSAAITAAPLDGKVKSAAQCLSHGEAIYTLIDGKMGLVDGPSIKTGSGVTGMTLVPAMTDAGEDRLILSYENGAPLRVFDAETLKPIGHYTINNGFSIAGLDHAIAISTTSAPFGGSAFNEGLVAIADANDARLVVLSRNYILEAIDTSQTEN